MVKRRSERTKKRRAASRRVATPYHHGALPEALLAAAEKILERDGIQHLTLRAMAREAGVSHTAPQHHFGDMTGVLSELAAIGFARLRAAMLAATDADLPEARRGRPIGRAYVAFAQTHPGLFLLMFRSERLDMTRPALRAEADAAFALLERTGAEPASASAGAGSPLMRAAGIVARWSLVHGLSVLLIDNRLYPIISRLGRDANIDALIDAALVSAQIRATE